MTCRHYRNGCTLGLYGGRPSPGVCRQCPSYSGPPRGFGDLVRACVRVLFLGRLDLAERLAARVEALWSLRSPQTSAPVIPGAKPQCGCKARQRRLNQLLPFTHGNRLHRH